MKVAISLLLIIFLVHATGCRPTVHQTKLVAGQADPTSGLGHTVNLTIVGFNYTDKDINDFYVDGTGGGNLSVSSASGGGGGSVCCALYTTGDPMPEIEVRWQFDACSYNIRHDEDGTKFNDIFSIYKTDDVRVISVASDPKYLEIHIFPDGHVEAIITGELSAPRVALEQSRRVNGPFRKCLNGVKPG